MRLINHLPIVFFAIALVLDALAIYSLLFLDTPIVPAIGSLRMRDLYFLLPLFLVGVASLRIVLASGNARALDSTAGALSSLALVALAFSASSTFFFAQVVGYVAGANAAASKSSRLAADAKFIGKGQDSDSNA
jgi:hypothetical protein